MCKYATNRLLVKSHGETRLLEVFCEPRPAGLADADAEPVRWARDEEGRWYSFSRLDATALVESSSGEWFSILA